MAGTYGVTGTDFNGCYSQGFATAVVDSLPVITVNTATICLGQQTANLVASGAATYGWSGNNLITTTGNSVDATPSVPSTYTVTGTGANGCVSTATTAIGIYQLPVVTTPTVTPDCLPLCHTFTYTSVPAASSYFWVFGDAGPHAISVNSTHCYTVAGTFNPVVTITDINGCVNTASTSVTAFSPYLQHNLHTENNLLVF